MAIAHFWAMDVIHYSDMIQQLGHVDEHGQQRAFDISFYTNDGELVSLQSCKVTVGKRKGKIVMDERPRLKEAKRKNPAHFKNLTRNLVLPNQELRKVHIRLITQFNGQKVIP